MHVTRNSKETYQISTHVKHDMHDEIFKMVFSS